MATGHIMMAMSLDGFVARLDHSMDWLMKQNTQNEDHGFADFQASVDAIVMGSGSLRTVLSFDEWPYTKPVIVLSHALGSKDIPGHLTEKIEISQLDPKAIMDEAESRGFRRVYVDGGALIRSFLRAGLIADMKVTLVPILIGSGIKLFGELDNDVDLSLENVQGFGSGLVDLFYRLK